MGSETVQFQLNFCSARKKKNPFAASFFADRSTGCKSRVFEPLLQVAGFSSFAPLRCPSGAPRKQFWAHFRRLAAAKRFSLRRREIMCVGPPLHGAHLPLGWRRGDWSTKSLHSHRISVINRVVAAPSRMRRLRNSFFRCTLSCSPFSGVRLQSCVFAHFFLLNLGMRPL